MWDIKLSYIREKNYLEINLTWSPAHVLRLKTKTSNVMNFRFLLCQLQLLTWIRILNRPNDIILQSPPKIERDKLVVTHSNSNVDVLVIDFSSEWNSLISFHNNRVKRVDFIGRSERNRNGNGCIVSRWITAHCMTKTLPSLLLLPTELSLVEIHLYRMSENCRNKWNRKSSSMNYKPWMHVCELPICLRSYYTPNITSLFFGGVLVVVFGFFG